MLILFLAQSMSLDDHDKLLLSTDSLTDSKLLHEMTVASDRCIALKQEIIELQDELKEIQNVYKIFF